MIRNPSLNAIFLLHEPLIERKIRRRGGESEAKQEQLTEPDPFRSHLIGRQRSRVVAVLRFD